MDVTHRVRVPAPLDDVWTALLDPARLAVVVPGSSVDEVVDDAFAGTLRIKLGSSLVALAGRGRYVRRDAAARRVVVETTGADARGDAGVAATHTLSLAPLDGSAAETEVTVATTMTWSGRPARLGAGVVGDAVDRVLEQVGSRIAARVAEGMPWVPAPEPGTATDAGAPAAAVLDQPVEPPAPSPSPGPSPRPEPREYVYRPFSNTAEPHAVAARTFNQVVLRRAVPYAGLGALALVVLGAVVRRARR